MLTRLAVLVDYYGCNEAVEAFSDIWIDRLGSILPATYSEDLIRWLWISWVFNKSTQLGDVIKIALHQSKGAIDTYGLPIPSLIIEKIDQQRQESIHQITAALHDLFEGFQGEEIRCSFECDSIMLGALTKQFRSQGLPPCPNFPLHDSSFEAIKLDVERIRSPNWRGSGGRDDHYRHYNQCRIEPRIEEILRNAEDYIGALDWEELLSRNGRDA